MALDSRYPAGSQWRKWDLHIHTPASIGNGYGANDDPTWQRFIADLESLPPEFKAIGINDYLFIDGYRKVLDFKQEGRLANIDLILPVLEFRLAKFAGSDERLRKINFHVIISDEIKIEVIQQQFLNALTSKYKLSPGLQGVRWSGVISQDSLTDLGRQIKATVPPEKLGQYGSDLKEGFNNLTLDEDQILSILGESTYFKKGNSQFFLTAVGKTEWESLAWADGSIADKKDQINKVDLVFIASENPDHFQRAKAKLKEQHVNDLLLDCSDAHYFSDQAAQKDRVGNCFTWIKADPTFEGLRQILFEPEERLRIQDRNPEIDFVRPFFSRIKVNAQPVFTEPSVVFRDIDIPLNRSLVAIIGGRGTGKSLLLDGIFKTFNKKDVNERIDAISLSHGFDVYYAKEESVKPTRYEFEGENILSYLHVTQGEVKEIVHPPDKLYQHIFSILGMDTETSYKGVDERITGILSQMAGIKRWLEYTDSEGNRTNTRQYNEKKKTDSEQLIGTLTTSKNQSLIQEYRYNKTSLGDNERKQSALKSLKENLTEFATGVNETIRILNSELGIAISEVDFTAQLSVINAGMMTLQTEQTKLQNKNNEIEESFKTQGIEGDVTTLLEKVNYHSSEFQRVDSMLAEIKRREDEYARLLIARNNFGLELIGAMRRQRDGFIKNWKELQKGKDGWSAEQKQLVHRLLAEIAIKAVVQFDKFTFVEGLYQYLNGHKFRETSTKKPLDRVSDCFQIHNWWDFVKFIQNKPIFRDDSGNPFTLDELLTSEFIPYNQIENVLSYLYENRERSKYLQIVPIVKYKGKTPNKLSVGQRGTLFVSLKLATDAFMTPFVFDQPEDDLDNEFIMTDLVPIFKQIKKYRQVIIVTHNANLVVNADAEQVIVAHNEDENIRYISGALENTSSPDPAIADYLLRQGIREHVCQILEGGKIAFEKREQKYGFR